MTWVLILASSTSLARVSSQLQLLTQAAFTLNRGLVEPKAKWTLPEPLKCSYFSIPWGKCWHGFPCPSWAGTTFPRSAADSSNSRRKQEMHLLPISLALIKRNRKLLPTYLRPRQHVLLCQKLPCERTLPCWHSHLRARLRLGRDASLLLNRTRNPRRVDSL